jgi:NAD(P)-dependent dehydrogenase (short-subunit alcohol dehydrogenase family)
MLDERAGLAGKTAVVLGGGDGIGRHVSLALAEAGIDLAICDNATAALAETEQQLKAMGRKVLAMEADVLDEAAQERFYDAVAAQCDRLDIVIHMAGAVRRGFFVDSDKATNARDIRYNFGYILDSVRRAVPLIRKGGRGGSIISFTTIEAHRGAAGFAVYAGAKAATTNWTRAVAVELAAEGIRLNTIAPDTTPSANPRKSLGQETLDAFAEIPPEVRAEAYKMYIPQKTSPTRDDLANAVLFLASDLSKSITGSTIHVDGGTSASFGFVDWPFGDGWLPAPLAGTLSRLFRDGVPE